MDVLTLSRIQFALTIAFHYLFPPLSIGLGVLLVIMEGMYLKTGNELYHKMTRFWVKIFGLIFAIGVASGIVMEFQFGTNWSQYSRYVGDVFGSALAAEGIFAFFLESGFLAILLFGWDKVKPRTHFIATLLVALGAHFSAIWIIVANSWMQTPAGYVIVSHNGEMRAEVASFWGVVFNPSTVERLSHVICAAWLTGAFLVLSVSAFYIIKNRHLDFAESSFKIALIVAAVASLGQLATGHFSAQVVSRYQPAKLAAFEGHYAKETPADMFLCGWVNEKEEAVIGVKIPGMLSFLVHGDSQKTIPGLKSFPPQERPPVNIVFQSYHLMVAIGFALILLTWVGMFLWWRGGLFEHHGLLWLFVFAVLGPQIANQVGWMAAEIGRQPYIVQGVLKTADAFSSGVTAGEALASLVMFAIIYALLFALFIYLLNEKIQKGPVVDEHEESMKGIRA